MTIDEFQRNGPTEGLWELVDDEPVEKPLPGVRHSSINLALVAQLWIYAKNDQLGYVFPANTGFVLSETPAEVRTPSGAFVRKERLATRNNDTDGYLLDAPDIAIEGVSPWIKPAEALARAIMWREAGSSLVWVIDSTSDAVVVCGDGSMPRVLAGDDTLDGGDILPGFALHVRDIFVLL
jgi:Uma2 family endonuclease